jgi:hypothetical protein
MFGPLFNSSDGGYNNNNVGYFYPDEIARYDGSLMPQIDRTISKQTLLVSSTKISR